MRSEDSQDGHPPFATHGPALEPPEAAPLFPVAADEQERLRSLYSTGYLDMPANPQFDSFTRLAAHLYQAPIAAISLIAAKRAWLLSAHGLPHGLNTPREDSFCARCSLKPGGVMIVEDAAQHPEFSANPLVTGPLGFRFYAGVAVKDADGHALGVLCVVDTQPRSVREGELAHLRDLANCISALIQRDQKISQETDRDPVSGLPNRQALLRTLGEKLNRYHLNDAFPTLITLDIEHFEQLRNSIDPRDIDTLLKAFAARLEDCFPQAELLAHLGADEFAALLPQRLEPAELEQRLTDAIERLGEPFLIGDRSLSVTVTAGLASTSDEQLSADRLLRNTILAKRGAHTLPLDKWQHYTPDLESSLPSPYAPPQLNLRRALQLGELALAFQPIVATPDRRVVGAETLLRWNHPELGSVPPAEFIPLAEKNGTIIPIGTWVLREACREAARWPANISISVNVSPAQINRALPKLVAETLAEFRLPAARLMLEVTETTVLEASQDNVAILEELRSLGVQIVLDDFGTGFSSLNYLLRFPFDKMKIDRSFVSGALERHDCQTIVHAIIGIGDSLGIPIVAEGVETAEQLAWLHDNGCRLMQGYFTGRPLPCHAFRTLLPGAQPGASAA
ncbi:putative bifunctional diguanylate cyclase/phosphodiesterase [Pseudomonas citronellolis]|uniref:putative bifunctional diguanylate cyclase/phosphodiesterase n=1 Tax=Pseudomonas citronellolis TaxID=53408 RepID=UPI0023E4739E|nr:sensor domain-containing phosphodiesterase [Pseudomonas citronellolis]MDF3931071.1 sensor domain-containing phosphodiesterase [Pseudomonas citronellolis]